MQCATTDCTLQQAQATAALSAAEGLKIVLTTIETPTRGSGRASRGHIASARGRGGSRTPNIPHPASTTACGPSYGVASCFLRYGTVEETAAHVDKDFSLGEHAKSCIPGNTVCLDTTKIGNLDRF